MRMAKNIFQNQMVEEHGDVKSKMIPRALFGSPNPTENDRLASKVYTGKVLSFQRRWNFNLDESENCIQRGPLASGIPEENQKLHWVKSSQPKDQPALESPLFIAQFQPASRDAPSQMEVSEESLDESRLSISPKFPSPPTPVTSPVIQNKTKPKFLFPPVLRQRTISEYMKIKKVNRAKKI